IFILFPEGGYHKNHNRVGDFKPGSFKSAMVAKVPIVPVALFDSYKAFEGMRVGIINTEVHYLKPITPEEYEGMKTQEVAQEVRRRIVERITEREKELGRKISNPVEGDVSLT
nr:1-acyl-sn-glycerol-3-phosphate acyltransferase [Lachnospiraceae bacterium]